MELLSGESFEALLQLVLRIISTNKKLRGNLWDLYLDAIYTFTIQDPIYTAVFASIVERIDWSGVAFHCQGKNMLTFADQFLADPPVIAQWFSQLDWDLFSESIAKMEKPQFEIQALSFVKLFIYVLLYQPARIPPSIRGRVLTVKDPIFDVRSFEASVWMSTFTGTTLLHFLRDQAVMDCTKGIMEVALFFGDVASSVRALAPLLLKEVRSIMFVAIQAGVNQSSFFFFILNWN
jgi:hypothetical protein